MKNKVAIGIAAYGPQPPSFWLPYSESISRLHEDGIEFDGTYWKGTSAVDVNRNEIVHEWYNEQRSEWLWWIDADNPPPIGSLKRLLQLNKPLVSGVYYSTQRKGVSPIAYLRDHKTGIYYSLTKWTPGELRQVDAVGMGCFLTHRDVYTDIVKEYTVCQRSSGGLVVVHNDDIRGKIPVVPGKHPYSGKVRNGIYYDQVVQCTLRDAAFPFFMAQFTRTEDMPFCELAKGIGYEVWLDTSVEVPHCKEQIITGEDFRDQDRPDATPRDFDNV